MNQSLRESFFSEDELTINISENFTITANTLRLGNNITLVDANNSPGTNNYFLSSNGSSVFWKLVAPGVNADAAYTYTWTNNHIFQANITANAITAVNVTSNSLVSTNVTANAIIANGTIGTNGQFLTSNGTGIYWSTVTAIVPAGSNTQIQINDSGVLGAVNALTFNKTTNTVTVNGTINFSGNTVNNTIYTGQALTANAAAFLSLPNTGIVSNSLGVFVNSAYIATLAANVATYLVTAGITANSSTLQIANTIGLYANASLGTNGQFLASNGTTIYWATPPDVNTNAVVVSVTGSGNATVVASDHGKTFALALGTYGILTLPDPTTLSYGWSITVIATGSPATFQGAYITHAGTLGSKFIYRGTGYNTFILVGNTEAFRIWLSPSGTYYINCIQEPTAVACTRTYTGAGDWNSTATNWQTMPLNTFTGATTCYNNGSNVITVGAAGVYKVMYRVQLWNNDSVTATIGRGLAINGSLYQYEVGTITTQQSNYSMLNSTVFANPGDQFSCKYYTSNSTTWYYPDTDMLVAELIHR